LKLDRVAAAAGIVRVANANMERAIRLVSVERGHDPRDFALVAFGGCGGLHACEMAQELGIRTVIVPDYAGALSALGMLLADNVRDYAAGVLNRSDLEGVFRGLERTARRDMRGSALSRFADLRYAGQSYELTVPWEASDPARPFHAEHHRVYGYSDPARPIEVVTARVRAVSVHSLKPVPGRLKRAPGRGKRGMRSIYTGGRFRPTPVFKRAEVTRANGPALIIDYGSTTLVGPGWSVLRDAHGSLVLRC
jgi:N-methylhydantoinase A